MLGWSFYSQGTEATGASADVFVDYALKWLGYTGAPITSGWEKGQELARRVRAARTLLVLDGLEPLQHPPGVQTGRLKDPAMQALLRELQAENQGLCVVTTRVEVADVVGRAGVVTVDLETLPKEAGGALLKELGVRGTEADLEAASEEFGGHALALTLLGTYLRDVCEGDVRRRGEVALLEEGTEGSDHARRVMRSYETWLGEGPELRVLRLVGLFDRPAEAAAVAALRAEVVPGLTEGLGRGEEVRWKHAVARLVKARLVSAEGGGLDAHPLVREYFGERLRGENEEVWKAGHLRLYEHYKQAAPELPETLEAMMPLYVAVGHGCKAGRVQEVLDEVCRRRIWRGSPAFSVVKLGAFGAELTALAAFFEPPWSKPSSQLSPTIQAWLLNEAGFVLRALGRLPEAVEPMRVSTDMDVERGDLGGAAISAGSLSELTLTLGDVAAAVEAGAESVELADRSRNEFQRMNQRSKRADALHQAERWEEAGAAFAEAERMQTERQPEYPRLYSVRGYRYCDLLLSLAEMSAAAGETRTGGGAPLPGGSGGGLGEGSGVRASAEGPARARGVETPRYGETSLRDEGIARYRAACEEVRERAEQSLGWAHENKAALLDFALNHLSLGRAHLGLALTSPTPDFATATQHLNEAVAGLRKAGHEQELPRGLLARAALHRVTGNLAAARTDLTEALDIAERGHMRLHETDAHLEWARVGLSSGEPEAARVHVEKARALLNATGYERRSREVEWLERRLAAEQVATLPAGKLPTK